MAHARNTDPSTSHAAAASVDDVNKKQECVRYMFKNAGDMTDIELALMYDTFRDRNPLGFPYQSESGLRTRRSELVHKGILRDTGARERTPSGRWAIVWVSLRDETVHALLRRSDGCCEAYVELAGGVWSRCGRVPIHIHHMLRRSHGGELLDEALEIYHLIALCSTHHGEVHTGAYPDSGLLIEGNVYPGPVYVGPDEYLSEHYPPKEGS